MSGRRLLVLLLAATILAVPAAALRALCVGRSCPARPAPARVPFCGLPEALRTAIAHGFRDGRSPDVLTVAAGTPPSTAVGDLAVPWPTTAGGGPDLRVPLAIAGPGVRPGTRLAPGVTLDRVAPTLAALLGFDRPFPQVRSGTPLELPPAPADGSPRLVLLVAWKGVGAADLRARPRAWPFLASLIREGAGTPVAETGSLPLDPTAVLTTIGTGGLPFQHGMAGSLVRDDAGDVVEAFGPRSPVHVIATLADDLEHAERRTLVGLVGTAPGDRGLVGGGWYPDEDPVDAILGDPATAPLAVRALLDAGYGRDRVPDVLGVALQGDLEDLDRWTRRIVTEARAATGGEVLVAVAGTGSATAGEPPQRPSALVRAVEAATPGAEPVVAAEVPGGLFLDERALTELGITGQAIAQALLDLRTPRGERMFADAFQGFAVTFSRYC